MVARIASWLRTAVSVYENATDNGARLDGAPASVGRSVTYVRQEYDSYEEVHGA